VWEAANGRELLSLRGHNAGINAAVFSADGQRIVTGSSDQTAKLWDLASGRELLSLKGHSARINAVAISADGHRIVTGSSDQTAKVWEAATVQEVAVWQDEKRVEARHLAAIERERAASQERQRTARARDSIKQWLILAPIPLASSAQSGSEGLEAEQIEGEGQLRPKAEETRSIGNSKLKWRKVTLEDYVIDFNAIVGQVTDHCVAYAVCYIRSESDHRGLQMLVCSDDQAKVYLNGKQVHKYPFARLFLDVEDIVTDLALNEGLNVLIFKVVNELGEWKGSVRFADPLGNAVKGIQVTLDPDAQN
jgi:WD40 repeat protein